MSKRKTIEIPAPIVGYNKRCRVLNYYKRPPRWETGVVIDLKYEAMHGPEYSWHYSVRPDRYEQERKGVPTLFVTDAGISPRGRNRG